MKKEKSKNPKDDERKPNVETPRPPQDMDPSRAPGIDEEPDAEKEVKEEPKKEGKENEKKKLSGQSPLEIDDEATI